MLLLWLQEEDDPTSLEECEKQIEKLQKQHAQYRDKVFKESQHVRAIDLGQDRYKRNYWVLPHAGGLFLEGLESGEIKDIVLPKTRSERSESRTMKVEVIEEKTEKKGIEFLEDVPEKKASEILKEDVKEKEIEKKLIDGKQINGLIKVEKDVLVKQESEQNVGTENVKVVKEENETKGPMLNDGDSKTHDGVKVEDIKSEVLEDKKLVCNGDISGQDKSKEANSVEKASNCIDNSGNGEQIKSPTKHVELKIPNIKPSAIEEGRSEKACSSNLFLQVPQSTKLSDFCSMTIDAALKNETSESDHPKSSSETATLTSSLFSNTSFTDHVTKSTTNHKPPLPSPPCPPPAHSKTQIPERKSSFMSIDSILDKTSNSSHGSHLCSTSALPINPFVSQSTRSVSEVTTADSRPWFSLLPRVPCDDMSLTRGQHSSGMLLSPPFMSQLPFHPFSIQSPAFASFQMGQLFSSSMGTKSSSSSSLASSAMTHSNSEMSFKKPEPVNSSQNTNPEEVLKTLQGEAKPIPEGQYCLCYCSLIPKTC